MSTLRMFIHMIVHSIWTSISFPIAFVSALIDPKGGGIWVGRRLWGPFLIWASGSRLKVHGQENVDPRRPTIYVSNHQSALDIPVLFVALPVNFRFVAKNSLKWVPAIGWYLMAAGHILVDRGNRAAAVATLDRAAEKIRSGTNIVMYAEGTRSPDGRLLPFKKGPFALALKAGVAICPVTIEGTVRVMPKNSWKIVSGITIHVRISPPIDASRYGPGDRERLMRDVRRVIVESSLALGGKGGDLDEGAPPTTPPPILAPNEGGRVGS